MSSIRTYRHKVVNIVREYAGFFGVLQKSHPPLTPIVDSIQELGTALRPEVGLSKAEQLEKLDQAIIASDAVQTDLAEAFGNENIPWHDIQQSIYASTILGIANMTSEISSLQQRLGECLELKEQVQSLDSMKAWLAKSTVDTGTILREARVVAEHRDYEEHQAQKAAVEWSELAGDVEAFEAEKKKNTEN